MRILKKIITPHKSIQDFPPDPTKKVIRKPGIFKTAPAVCSDTSHEFVSHPFRCRRCGLICACTEEQIHTYIGSYFNGVAYQWSDRMDKRNIVSFSLSVGDRPVRQVSCDFSRLTVRRCLNGSRDGWMQSRFPPDYFEPKTIKLSKTDARKIKQYINGCDFSVWMTPDSYAINAIMRSCGFHPKAQFTCQFKDGREFTCLKPKNVQFEQLVSLLEETAQRSTDEGI